MNTIENAHCFVIHSKPFKDTSAIVELLSRDFGRVSVVFKGVRSSKYTAKSRVLQPFQPLLASWSGRGELKSGKSVEQTGALPPLFGKKLFSGLYLNELILRLMYRDAPAEGIYEDYQCCLPLLAEAENIELPLRQFEYKLLGAIGYQLPCEADALSGAPIVEDGYYRYQTAVGFSYEQALNSEQALRNPLVFRGELLLAFSRDKLTVSHLHDAKRLMRLALAPHLGNKPLESKKLFMGLSK